MIRIVRLVALVLALCATARAQDVQGIELCTRETSMDRRTGCLQSNVQYLQSVIAKNAAEARQKLGAAAGEIGALKGEVAGLKGDVAALKAALTAVQARLDRLETAAKPAAKPGTPSANPPDKPPETPAAPAK
jgi:TolA-binding protein